MGRLETCHVILVTRISHDTVHFWAPTFKWGISIANIADFSKPPETLSYPQQLGTHLLGNSFSSSPFDRIVLSYLKYHCAAVTCTGLIWTRYSMVITPVCFVSSSEGCYR